MVTKFRIWQRTFEHKGYFLDPKTEADLISDFETLEQAKKEIKRLGSGETLTYSNIVDKKDLFLVRFDLYYITKDTYDADGDLDDSQYLDIYIFKEDY